MIFIIENLNIQVLIWSYLQFLLIIFFSFQLLQGGLYNQFENSSFEVKIFRSAF